MPTDAGYVGPLDLPLAAGSPGAEIDDPVVSAILDLLGFVTKNALNARLANVSGAPADACPDDGHHRFAFDPFEPRANHVKRPVPSLFAWWDGNSTPWRPSQLQWGRERQVRAMYIYPELPKEVALNERRGLFSAVEAAWIRAAERDGHLGWSFNGAPTGTTLSNSWGSPVAMEWEWMGGQGVDRVGVSTVRRRRSADEARSFPAYVSMFRVRELVQPRQPEYPADLNDDHSVTLYHDDVPILERYLGAPDGSEQL